MTLCLESTSGTAVEFPVDRWYDDPTPEEVALLARLVGPVLDVGCGPGRLVLALNRAGVIALGVDASPAAVATARARGATAIERSVFDPIPATGRWQAALLLDGNIGIGGDPETLLARLVELLRPGGTITIEVEPPGITVERLTVRLDDGHTRSPWFGWSRVGVDGIATVADAVGLDVTSTWEAGGRWFSLLTV